MIHAPPLYVRHPVVRLIPFAKIEVAPFTVKIEPLLPIVALPFWSMKKTVVVALAVDVETERSGVVARDPPARESIAYGEVVPIPTLPALLIKRRALKICAVDFPAEAGPTFPLRAIT